MVAVAAAMVVLAAGVNTVIVNCYVCTVPYHTHAHMQHTNDKKTKSHRQLMSKILHHFVLWWEHHRRLSRSS